MTLDRRQFLRRAALFSGGAALTAAGAIAGASLAPAPSTTAQRFHADDLIGSGEDIAERFYRFRFVGQPVMDAQTLFFLSGAATGNADVGEVLGTALTIPHGDELAWFHAWRDLGRRIQALAEECLGRGHRRSAAAHFRRAGTYYRAGLIRYTRKDDPALLDASHAAIRCHAASLDLMDYDHEVVEIPFAGAAMHARWYRSPRATGPAPALLLHQGLHAWPEDTMWVIDEALARGIHVLALHGPGQGMTLRAHGLAYQHDWEVPIGAAVDHMEARPFVDASRMALMGLSFGGHLVVRAAAFEHRFKVVIANPGAADWASLTMGHLQSIPGLLDLYHSSPAGFDATVATIASAWPDAAWYFEDAGWKHGTSSPHALITEIRKFDTRAHLDRIRAHVLVMEGDAEDVTPEQGRVLCEALGPARSTYMHFAHGSGAETHCQAGGFILARMRLFDWMDEHFV